MRELPPGRRRTATRRLDRHTARVDCNVCHVPTFAKVAPTDMVRDWSLPGDLNPATKLYEPHMTLESHVTPEYRFFNGRSEFYQFGTRRCPGERPHHDGRPARQRHRPGAKIIAMKHHLGRQPIDPATGGSCR